jgi:N-formylglutamate amidohydrolase
MQRINGSKEVPVIYTAHHASYDFHEFSHRVALTEKQKVQFSDYGTADTVPHNGIATFIAQHGRALGDLNRDPDDPNRFQTQDYAQPQRHPIWYDHQELIDAEKSYCQSTYYEPFHASIVAELQKQSRPTFVVAWDNTAHYTIGKNEAGEDVLMKPIILSNRGDEETAHNNSEATSCDPQFLEILADNLRIELQNHGLPNEVHLNLVFKGGYICRQYSSIRNPDFMRQNNIAVQVQSLQVEYDTALTHNQETLEPNSGNVAALRKAFSDAIASTIETYKNN